MASRRGRNITDFGQAFPSIGGVTVIPPLHGRFIVELGQKRIGVPPREDYLIAESGDYIIAEDGSLIVCVTYFDVIHYVETLTNKFTVEV